MWTLISTVVDSVVKAATFISGVANGTTETEKSLKKLERDKKLAADIIDSGDESDVNALFRK